MNKMGTVAENLKKLLEEMDSAAAKTGRSFEDITLIAVSKARPPEAIEEAFKAGIRHVGENRANEMLEKQALVEAALSWHYIGPLQTNKVRRIVGKCSLIHSVDSLRLAAEINKRSAREGLRSDILIQVNAAGETQKSGVAPNFTESLIREISASCPNLRVRGLMQIAPIAENPEDVREYFRLVYRLYDSIGSMDIENVSFDCLSMGMSGDFRVAIEEGANMVRIGRAIFGNIDKV